MISISIDGAAGTGKSTIAKKIAEQLGYNYVNTGEMYRALTYYFVKNNIEEKNEVLEALNNIDLKIEFKNNKQITILNDKILTNKELRQEEIGNKASIYSQIKEVRDKAVAIQRDLNNHYNIVMEGRDIGTVVLPNANVKFFVTAKLKVRAKRRYDELIAKNKSADFQQIYKDMKKRDYNDKHRKLSALKVPKGAYVIDTTKLTVVQVVDKCMNIIKSQNLH